MDEIRRKSYVYLLGDWEKDGLYKIGVTRGDINKRIKKLQTGNSGEIYLIEYFETDIPFTIEKLIHQKLSPNRKRGEWFELSDEERFKFREYCEFYTNMLKSVSDNPFLQKLN